MFKRWAAIPLWQRILIGLVLGILAGVLFRQDTQILKPIGDLFINAIRMLIVPLIFTTLVAGMTSMDHPGRLASVGAKAFGLYLGTTAIAISIGLAFGHLLQPGAGLSLPAPDGMTEAAPAPTFAEVLVGLIPTNPIAAFAEGNVLQIIVFALLIGTAIVLSGDKAKPVKDVIISASEVMYRLTHLVMELAPFGVFALIAVVAGQYGLTVLLPLLKLMVAIYAACLVHIVVTYGGLVSLIARLSPVPFFRGIVDAQAVAFTTASSSATLPVTMSCVEDNLGVSKSTSGFVLPLGATINMDGTALYQGVAALFVAQAIGVDLSVGQHLVIIATATLAAIGSAGIPGAGLIMLTLVLTSVGLPLEGVAVIAGIDRLLDMMRTMTNVTGDAAVAVTVGKSEGTLDVDSYKAAPIT